MTDIAMQPPLPRLNSRADLELGKLIGATSILPNPGPFVFMYVRHEAVLSSQIEGTRTSLRDLLEYEASLQGTATRTDVAEVSNQIAALRYGLERVQELPLSLQLIREIHRRLMDGVREGEPASTPVKDEALDRFEKALHAPGDYPVLVKIGLAHAQFETLQPFLDGNGRMGRLLVTLLLCQQRVLDEPLLYLSRFFKQNRHEYHERLQAIRDRGDWEGWLAFFLEGVATVAIEATGNVRKIVELRENAREQIARHMGRRVGRARQLLDGLFESPVVSVKDVERMTGLSQPAANALTAALVELGLLEESTGRRRNRVFTFERYLGLFEKRGRRS